MMVCDEKSLFIDLHAHFGSAQGSGQEDLQLRLPIRHADITVYRKGADRAVVQEFDGKQGYLYGFEFTLGQAISIPMNVKVADLHIMYLVEGHHTVTLTDTAALSCSIAAQRARYLYLPSGDYFLHVRAGYHQVFGFYFDGGIFRDGNDRSFRFLQEILTAYRSRSADFLHSIDFRVGPQTLRCMRHLCRNLKKGDLDNEAFVLTELTRLIQLSKRKVHEEYEQINPVQHLADNAIELVKAYVHTHGQAFSIQHVASDLGVTAAHLCRVFKDEKLPSPRSYKNRFLLVRCKKELLHYQQLGDVAERCQFSSVASFSRFFKKHTGQTPGAYKDELYRLHHRVSL